MEMVTAAAAAARQRGSPAKAHPVSCCRASVEGREALAVAQVVARVINCTPLLLLQQEGGSRI